MKQKHFSLWQFIQNSSIVLFPLPSTTAIGFLREMQRSGSRKKERNAYILHCIALNKKIDHIETRNSYMSSTKGLAIKCGSFCFLQILAWRLTVPLQQLYSRVQNVQQPSQCETKPLQTFSFKWIKTLLLPKEALRMSKRGGQPETGPSVTPVTGEFSEKCKEIAKGKLTLNNTGWTWMYPERKALWQPDSKKHQLHPLQVKQKHEQHCNKLSRSPKTEEHAAALLKIVSLSWKQENFSWKLKSVIQTTGQKTANYLQLLFHTGLGDRRV